MYNDVARVVDSVGVNLKEKFGISTFFKSPPSFSIDSSEKPIFLKLILF